MSFLEKNLLYVRQSPTTSPAKKKQPKFQLNDKSDMGESKTPPNPGTLIISSNKKQDTTNTPSNTDKLHTHVGGGTIAQKGGAVETTRDETQASTEASGRSGTGEEEMTDDWEGLGGEMVGEIRTGTLTMEEYKEINTLLGWENSDDKEGGVGVKRRVVQQVAVAAAPSPLLLLPLPLLLPLLLPL